MIYNNNNNNNNNNRWLVTSTGRYVNVWGYRLLTGAMNIYLKGS